METGQGDHFCTSLYDLIQFGKLRPPGINEENANYPFNPQEVNTLNKHRHSASLQNLYKLLDENKVLMQGTIHWLHGNLHRWSKCWAVVRGYGMTIYNTNREYKPVKVIPIADIQDVAEINVPESSHKYFFTVITQNKPIEFRVDNEDSLILWVAALKTSIDKANGTFTAC